MKALYRLNFMLLFLFYAVEVWGQSSPNGCIISIENNAVYVDLTAPNVKTGDVLGVYVRSGYMTDPTTGRRVRKADELIGELKISSIHQGYSLAYPMNGLSINNLKSGMTVKLKNYNPIVDNKSREVKQTPQRETNNRQTVSNQAVTDYMRNAFVSSTPQGDNSQRDYNSSHNNYSTMSDKATVVIAPAQVNDVVNSGHFGGYVADVLMEQLLMCNDVRVLDRSVLDAQIDEINLAGDIIDPSTAIQRGKVAGVKYMIQLTMQKPDVVNVRNGIPLASIMGAVGAATGRNIGAQYASNMKVGTLKASVSISARVVDMQTGEVLFMTSGTGNAKGKSQLAFEYGALGGGEINGGADGFKQTVTGKAIQQAFVTIGRNLRKFFSGNTSSKVMGSATGYGNYGQQMAARGMKLYMGTEKLDKDGVAMALSENQSLYFKYKNAKRKHKWGTACIIAGILSGGGLAGCTTNSLVMGAGAGVLACGVIGGICIYNSSKKIMNEVANEYNRSQKEYADASLNFVFKGNGLGLCLTF